MPMPKPKPMESQKDFLSRFMSDETMLAEYPDDKQRMAIAEQAWSDSQESLKNNEELAYETVDVDGVEIFKSGTWNGDKYTDEDLDEMVCAHNEIGAKLKPYVKLGHDNGQALLQKDGYPSAGWIKKLYRTGNTLFADLGSVPKKIKSLIDSKAYGRISPEIYWNAEIGGKKYKRAVKAMALLGGNTPAVTELNDFINLYTENNNVNAEFIKLCSSYEGDTIMDEKQYADKISELETQVKEYSAKNSDLQLQLEKIEIEKLYSEANSILDAAEKEGKIVPAQRSALMALATDKGLKSYSSDGKSIEGSGLDFVKSVIENSPKVVDFSEASKQNVPEKSKNYSAMDETERGEELDKRAKVYSKENNVTYKEALKIVSMEV
jgi:hypothetical protein